VKAVTFRIKFNGFESDTQISEEFLHLNAKGTIAFAAKKFNQSINHRIKQVSVVVITTEKINEWEKASYLKTTTGLEDTISFAFGSAILLMLTNLQLLYFFITIEMKALQSRTALTRVRPLWILLFSQKFCSLLTEKVHNALVWVKSWPHAAYEN